jgi:hypothetical protein
MPDLPRPPRPPMRVRYPSVELTKRFDELIDVPMRYWTEAGKQWRDKVLEARQELNRMIGMMAEEDHARRQTTESGGR